MEYEVRVVRIGEETEEVIDTKQIKSLNYILVHPGETQPSIHRNVDTLRIDEKHVIKQIYCQLVEKLRELYKDHIGHVNPNRIMFLVNDVWEPTEKASFNSKIHIDIKKASKVERTFTGYDYVISMKAYYLDDWTNAQVAAAIMSQLLRIDPNDNSVRKNTSDLTSKLVATFGAGYLENGAIIEDISETMIELKEFPKAVKEQMEITEFIGGENEQDKQ